MKSKRLLLLALPFVITALLLTVIQAPIDLSACAWVALVPFVLACSPDRRWWTLAVAAYGTAILYWLGNLYWIAPITAPGWMGMAAYVALLWPLLALAIRSCRRWRIPLVLALPILVVGTERLQGFPLGGFYWRLLGHSQHTHTTVIQIADLLGVAGVTFVVALVNGFLSDLVLAARSGKIVRKPRLALLAGEAVFTVAVVGGTLLYGQWRIRQSPAYVSEGPLVAALQSNVPQSVKGSRTASDELFDGLLAQSQAAAAAGAEFIAWPETMVQAILQPELWPYLSPPPEQDKLFHETLSRHARDTAFVLVGAYGANVLTDRQGKQYLGNCNSAFLYRADGQLDRQRYDKIHLVLFGEYIPFRRSFNWLYEQLKRFTPKEYHYDYSLEHGTHYTIFDMATPIRRGDPNTPRTMHRFGIIICYEDAIPYVAKNFALDDAGNKRIDWLVNISNDGWFVRFDENPERVVPSTELPQHAAVCTFRAVENRLPILRSVNTGVSCLIDSLGRVRNGYLAASEGFPARAMDRTGMAGWFADRMPIDRRVSLFSRHGQWFDNCCAAVFAVTLAVPVALGLVKRRIAKRPPKSAKRRKVS